MSYGSYACHATVITEDGLFELCQEYNIPKFSIEDVDYLYSELEDFLDDMQREFCELINSKDVRFLPDNLEVEVYSTFERAINFVHLIEQHTGLILELNYEGETGGADDDINQEFYWKVINAYQYTPQAKKYKHYLAEAYWVVYG